MNMKSLTQLELDNFVSDFAVRLKGAQLQEVITNDRGLALGFQGAGRYWLVLDLVPNTPMLLLFDDYCPFRKSAKPKPLGLFLNSHGRNLIFSEMVVLSQFGRVVCLKLANSIQECELEIHLIPKQCNLLVRANGKQISWEKPLELGPVPQVEDPPAPRSVTQIHEEWLALQKSAQGRPALDPQAQWEKQKSKDLEKKKKALLEIQKQIDSDHGELWSEAGVFLKTHMPQSWLVGEIPTHLRPFINVEQNLSWNIENCFFKSKQAVAKKVGARERLELIKQEIETLEKRQYSPKRAAAPSSTDLMRKADARGRKLVLASGALAYCGRSAADNLALLRQAKSWDYWLHLKDYPGAHAIIHRQRDQLVSEKDIQQVAEWVAKESLSAKGLSLGQKVAVVIVECRFVRPIKGDKLGRVTYHSEKTLSFILK